MSKENSWFGITNRFIDLVLKNEEGELTPEEYQEQGNELAQELQNKGTATQGYILQEEAEIKAIKEQITRLTEYCKTKEKRVETIKSRVKESLESLGIQKLETPIGVISISKCPASVEIEDETLIPKEFIKEKVTTSIDKTAIKEALKSGQDVQGAKLVENKTTLKMK